MIQFENAVKKFRAIILDELETETNVRCWAAGGSVRDHFLGKGKITTDIDLFFTNVTDYDLTFEYLKFSGFVVVFESDNGCKVKNEQFTFDLVKIFYRDPKHCIDSFDFTVSMFAVDKDRVYHGPTSFIDLAKKQLMLNQIPFPISTFGRTLRYYQKGYRMCKEEQLKLLMAIYNSHDVGSLISRMSSMNFMSVNQLDEEVTSGMFKGID